MIVDCKDEFDIICPLCRNNLGTFNGSSFKGARSMMMRCKCGVDVKALFLPDGTCDVRATSEKPAIISTAAQLGITEIEFHDMDQELSEVFSVQDTDDVSDEPYPWAGCEATIFREIIRMLMIVDDFQNTIFESIGITHTKGEGWVEIIVKDEFPEKVGAVAELLPHPVVHLNTILVSCNHLTRIKKVE